MKKTLLVISNGHGEDIIGANILKELLSTNGSASNQIDIKVLPVVGKGQAYMALPVNLAGPARVLPSGGFMRNSLQNLWHDLKAGLLGLTLSQIRYLRKLRDKVDLVLVVGDILVLLLAGLFVKKEIIFLPTAKSEYISGHYRIEELIMSKMAGIVIPRDQKTADALKKAGINVLFPGNAMMDCFEIKGVNFNIPQAKRIIGILPGSREEAYDNMISILKVIEEIEKRTGEEITYLTAMAPNLSVERLKYHIKETKWRYKDGKEEDLSKGIKLILLSPEGSSTVRIIYHHFGDVLNEAEVFIGLAGTANEQAAGMGKPVVVFPGKGPQFNERFALAQKKLLGGSVKLLEYNPEKIALALLDILNNKNLYKEMSRKGKERMGGTGAIKKIVEIIKLRL
jgi:uncharacterized protein (TIGR03492 family)